ncbi:MAG: EamA family transporter [bacterium]|nr:EamA family transporter [bacterium]
MKTNRLWLWYSLLTIVFWSVWALLSKVASDAIGSATLQVLFTLGSTLVMAWLLLKLRFRVPHNRRGVTYGLLNGVFAGLGGIAFFEALRRGGPASLVVPLTSLYPLITVVLAIVVLRERLNGRQRAGVVVAMVALFLLTT